MHADEVETTDAQVRRLLRAQFPEWAELAIERVASAGTDNAIYRLGDALAVRMPRVTWAVGQVEKEWRWLRVLAPNLPLAIPVPVARGEPGEGYPWRWTVGPWLAGEPATLDQLRDPCEVARDLACFVAALRRVDARGGPPPDASGRGLPLATRDRFVRRAIDALDGEIDREPVVAAWESALAVPPWAGPPVWVHGDLAAGNLLAVEGRLRAVIDFGCLAVGDPAADLHVGWTLFEGASRAAFREGLAVDDASWARGRGWALSWALIALPYYLATNPAIVASARRTIAAVLAERGASPT